MSWHPQQMQFVTGLVTKNAKSRLRQIPTWKCDGVAKYIMPTLNCSFRRNKGNSHKRINSHYHWCQSRLCWITRRYLDCGRLGLGAIHFLCLQDWAIRTLLFRLRRHGTLLLTRIINYAVDYWSASEEITVACYCRTSLSYVIYTIRGFGLSLSADDAVAPPPPPPWFHVLRFDLHQTMPKTKYLEKI